MKPKADESHDPCAACTGRRDFLRDAAGIAAALLVSVGAAQARAQGLVMAPVRPVAAMVVAVGVDNDEPALALGHSVEERGEHPVIFAVDGERSLGKRRVELARFPHLEAPALLGRPVNRFVGPAVEVELEARAVDDEVERHRPHRLAGERVLLAKPVGLSEPHLARDFGAKLVAVVNGGRKHRPGAMLHRPPPAAHTEPLTAEAAAPEADPRPGRPSHPGPGVGYGFLATTPR